MTQGNYPSVILNSGKKVYVEVESSEPIQYDQNNPGLHIYGPLNILDGLASAKCNELAARFIEKVEVLFGIKYIMNVHLMTDEMALKIKNHNPGESPTESALSEPAPTEFLKTVADYVLGNSLNCVAFDPNFGAFASIDADGNQESLGFNSTLGEEEFPVCNFCGNVVY